MKPLTHHTGVAAPLLNNNIDTDAIIPSREMKLVSKKGLENGLFAAWRYSDIDARTPNPDFVLNKPAYKDCSIILSGTNFGCGSSREHAAWALAEYGIKVIIAASFGSIFKQNCTRNGIAAIELHPEVIAAITEYVAENPTERCLTVDLNKQLLSITHPEQSRQEQWSFVMEESSRQMLIQGLDPIALTLTMAPTIASFEARLRQEKPWFFLPLG